MIGHASASENMQLRSFESGGGARIFQIPLREFPILQGYAYLVLVEGDDGFPYRVLIDTGSGYGDSNADLEGGLSLISSQIGQAVSLGDLTHVLITHGHIDHFGGLTYVRPRTPAQVGVHELDRRNLAQHEERLAVVARRLANYLVEAGVSPHGREHMLNLYMLNKSIYHSVPVDFNYEAAGMRLGPFEMLHVPGHCAGHVVIRLHDVLFAGDHVLDEISPHQSPEQLTLSTGLDHYLKSLDAVQSWAGDVRLTLAGHGAPILDLPGRLDAIREIHSQRLERVLELLGEPLTIAEVSAALFGEVSGYNVLLAIEETGAHVEYLHQRGRLAVDNLADLEDGVEPVAIRYRRVSSAR